MAVSAAARRSTSAPSRNPVLHYGARSPQVARMQQLIARTGINVGPVDGIFGPKTLAGLKAYQASRGLAADGVAGPKTWGALNGNAGAVHHPVGPSGTDSFSPGGGKQVTAYVNGQPRTISVVPVGNGQYLRVDAARAFGRMQAAARQAGINLGATSGFRTMAQQQDLYRRYLNGTGNLAARPGYSNHQNGIAMDISGVGGRGTAADHWLRAHAAQFGFRNLPSEFWHYDFVG